MAAEPLSNTYLPTVPIPRQLREHCKIYIEENLYNQSLNLLLQVLHSAISISGPVQIPPIQILSHLVTLSIHPSFSKSHTLDKQETANLALQYLSELNSTVGPVSSQLTNALHFRSFHDQPRTPRKRKITSDVYEDGSNRQDDISDSLATTDSLFTKSRDFWHCLGWTLNCSTKHPERYARWKLFIEFVVQVLEDDWTERQRIYNERLSEGLSKEDAQSTLTESLIINYVGGGVGSDSVRYGGLKPMISAIFAGGTSKDLEDFPEVWRGETKEAVPASPGFLLRQRRDMNIEDAGFWDYSEDSNEDVVDDITAFNTSLAIPTTTSTPRKRKSTSISTRTPKKRKSSITSAIAPTSPEDYPYETLDLRKRILSLLWKVSTALPSMFVEHHRLLDFVEEALRPIPLSTFSVFIMPGVVLDPCRSATDRGIGPPASHLALLHEIIRLLTAGTAPVRRHIGHLTQERLENEYLPFACTGGVGEELIVGNVRLGLCMEAFVRLSMKEVYLVGKDGRFKKVVENGVGMRQEAFDKGWKGSKRRKSDDMVEAKRVLEESSNRLLLLATLVEQGMGIRDL